MPSVTPLLVTHASARVRPVGALWRLRGYLKPFRTQMIVMFAAALGAVAAEIAIPLLTKSVVDGAIAHGDKQLLIPLALAAVALGAAVGLLNMIRRWIQSGAVADIEKSIRDDMYAHLQWLHASFHDNWQSGQLLSRATTDLSSIRRFAGFGLIFLVRNDTGCHPQTAPDQQRTPAPHGHSRGPGLAERRSRPPTPGPGRARGGGWSGG
jgi:ABC-type multidrug transport system fused ATPase/permease subunit